MNKKLRTLMLIGATATLSAFTFAGCFGGGNPNDSGADKNKPAHTYDRQITTSDYLKTPATCTERAVYYYSCECGERGDETFEYGTPNGHRFTNYSSDNNATCGKDGTKTATCDNCTETDTKTETGTKTGNHSYGNDGLCSVCQSSYLNFELVNNEYYRVRSLNDRTITDVVIPETYEGKPVKEIRTNAFLSLDIESIVIPDSVTTIGEYTFGGCKKLETVTFGSGVTDITAATFDQCHLSNITVSAENPYFKSENNSVFTKDGKALVLGNDAGYIPYGVEVIRASAFSCMNFESVTIPASVTEIGGSAFYGCAELESLTIPSSVTKIGGSAFCNCSKLTAIEIPDDVEEIGKGVFGGCEALASITVSEGNSVYKSVDNCLLTIDGKTLVAGCKTSIIPDGVETIAENAFYKCTGLESITLPESVTTLELGAFMNCNNLVTIHLPENVVNLTYFAFTGTTKLESITVSENNAKFESLDGILYTKNLEYFVWVPTSVKGDITVPCNIRMEDHTINYYFSNCKQLKNVTLSENVTSLSYYAFTNCSALESIEIPKSLTRLGYRVFNDCESLNLINYEGTMEEWLAIEKDNGWTYNVPDFTIHCSDGDLDKNGNKIEQS